MTSGERKEFFTTRGTEGTEGEEEFSKFGFWFWLEDGYDASGAASWSVMASREIEVGRGWNAPLPWFWKDKEASLEFIASVFCGSSEKRLGLRLRRWRARSCLKAAVFS